MMLRFAKVFLIAAALYGEAIGGDDPTNLALDASPSATSSASAPDGKYGAGRLVDGNDATHWASGTGYPLPCSVTLRWGQPVAFDTVRVSIFAREGANLYAYWKEAEIEIDQGLKRGVKFGPEESSVAIFRFEEPVETTSLELRILDVHDRKTYVGINEIGVYLDPDKRIQPPAELARPKPRSALEPEDKDRSAVYVNAEDLARARRNAESTPWGRAEKATILAEAARWLERDEAYWLEFLPEPGACYAYGFTGCPICGSSCGSWAGARCRWDQPRTVTCANAHTLPDKEHADAGAGHVAADGRIHYLLGTWNAWVTEQWTRRALPSLAHAYALTGDEKYAERAAMFFDALASIYPESTSGSWDYPSRPPSGRLARPWYQVSRNLVVFVEAYELIQGSKALEEPSLRPQLEAKTPAGPTAQQQSVGTPDARGFSRPGMTRRENIEANLLEDAAYYCYWHSFSGKLHNGHADYLRGALAVGALLGIREYVSHAVDSPYSIFAMLANNCDRDGRYYETALGYALHTRDLYLTFVGPLKNWRSEAHPRGIDLFADPRMQGLYRLPDAVMTVAGHSPNFGDAAPDNRQSFATAAPWSAYDVAYAEHLYAASSGRRRDEAAALLKLVCGGDVERARLGSSNRRWLLYHADPVAETTEASLDDDFQRRVFGSWFLGQKGIAIVRDGEGPDAQGLLLRYGPSLNHADFDDLGLLYYGKGWQLTYDVGYGLASTHTQVGWASQTVSHALVTVNESTQRGGSGGSLFLFADLPGLKLIEADSPLSYASQGVSQYRRTVALVGSGKDQYAVDFFRVRGGRQHDYGLGVQGQDYFVEGVDLGPEEEGSLAGTEVAWGERILPEGDIAGHANRPYWLAPPGNGYGFFYDIRRGRPQGPCFADWSLGGANQARFRVHLLPEPETEFILAKAPGLYPRCRSGAYLLARRKGPELASNFTTVMEPYALPAGVSGSAAKPAPILGLAERVAVAGGSKEMTSVGVHVRRDDRDEYLFSAGLDDEEKVASTVFGELRWRGAAVFLAGRDRKPESLATVGAWDVRIDGGPMGPAAGVCRGHVLSLDCDERWIETDFQLPQQDWLGSAVCFGNPGYSRGTAYRIYGAETTSGGMRIHLGPQSMLLGRGRVHELGEKRILSDVPHQYALSVIGGSNSRFFDGKLVQNDRGAATRIESIEFASPMKIHVEDTRGFQVGDRISYYDVQEGDTVAVALAWHGTVGMRE